jgi:hypothetical protein
MNNYFQGVRILGLVKLRRCCRRTENFLRLFGAFLHNTRVPRNPSRGCARLWDCENEKKARDAEALKWSSFHFDGTLWGAVVN